MIVDYTLPPTTVRFDSFPAGTTFWSPSDNATYIKHNNSTDSNAVNLATGVANGFNADSQVRVVPLKAVAA